MKVGMNLFLWTLELDDSMKPVLESLAEMGYDGVEVPIFNTSIDYAAWGSYLDDLGLARTAVAVRGDADNPASADPAIHRAAVAATNETLDCAAALGATALVGPLHSALGVFSGAPPTAEEWSASVDVIQQSCAHAESLGLELGIEALNRFECYLVNSQADAARYVRDVGAPNCKVLYDTFHANIEERTKPKLFVPAQANLDTFTFPRTTEAPPARETWRGTTRSQRLARSATTDGSSSRPSAKQCRTLPRQPRFGARCSTARNNSLATGWPSSNTSTPSIPAPRSQERSS